ncbi:MAG: cytochrome c nitrite reductase small subunit [Proteobacteria bacterium]|nr:cytochrome c nitrite reductase small subunit [Cystobacterineae bacterium]MCL2259524.1 cytochrome c nitrite reductase small subunit [Cystobacterineae bacterium]MCL2314003.1 cytochrome c nitrite reductase small subunit [Pseudomonadota bacterium]
MSVGQSSLLVGIAGLAVGLAVGIGSYTFVYAEGDSYLKDDAKACNNCHVMNEFFANWSKSSHHHVATCNDCHTPSYSQAAKYFVKARNGYNHAVAFTTGNFPDNIRITPANKEVVEGQCRACHSDIVSTIEEHAVGQEEISCVKCHRSAGHLH